MNAGEAFASLRGNGQPWFFVVQSVQIASSPEIVRDLMRYTVYGETPPRPLPPHPPMGEWLAMYRRHRSMQDAVAAGIGLPAELSASGELDDLRAAARMSQEELAAVISELTPEELQEFSRPFIGVPFPPDDAILRAMLEGLDAEADGADEDVRIDELMTSSAGQFFFRVWWPCWILYHDYPPRLLRAARLGDLHALDRLLRLDKYVTHDPGIARVIGEVMSSGSKNDKRRILNALEGRPKVRLTESRIRVGLAALISQLASVFHTKVTAPELQSLFDAIERVRSGNAADPKITAAGESWAKGIQRNRTWPSLPKTPPGQ